MMKRIFLAFALLFSSVAFGARFEIIQSDLLVNEEIMKLANLWSTGPGKYTDVYSQSAKIISKRPSEPYQNTIMQILWGTYTYQVSADPSSLNRSVLKKEIDFLFDASTWLQSEASLAEIKKYKKDVISHLSKFANDENVLIYVGVIEGDFSASFVHLSLVDLKNQQILSLIGGYAE